MVYHLIFNTIRFYIPNISLEFQNEIEKIIFKSYQVIQQCKVLYAQAETTLLQTLGLQNWQPSQEGKAIKSFSQSFGTSGRLDAEYYQPKYEELKNKLNLFEMVNLSNIVIYPISSGSTPKAGSDAYYTNVDNGFPFIRATDIENNRISDKDFIYIKPEVHKTILKKTQLKKNDILFSIAGTVGRCGIYEYDYQANINQACAIIRINEKKIMRDYLCMFYNSWVGKLYIEKFSRQGLQTNLNLDEVGQLGIPVLPLNTQKEIVAQIQQSFQLRQESTQLLNIAKQAVEIAIEQNEDAALQFIHNNT